MARELVRFVLAMARRSSRWVSPAARPLQIFNDHIVSNYVNNESKLSTVCLTRSLSGQKRLTRRRRRDQSSQTVSRSFHRRLNHQKTATFEDDSFEDDDDDGCGNHPAGSHQGKPKPITTIKFHRLSSTTIGLDDVISSLHGIPIWPWCGTWPAPKIE